MLIGDEVVTFLAVVQSGSLQQAAEIVHATQSTVSYRIQALEQRIGHALLLRSRGSRTLSLTAEGERFLDIAERWRTLEREAQQLGSKSDRSLSIGAADALALHVLQPFFLKLATREPPVRLNIETARYWELSKRVSSGYLRVAFSFVEPSHVDLAAQPIMKEQVVVARNTGAHRVRKAEIALGALDPRLEVYQPWSIELDMWRAKHGLTQQASQINRAHLLDPLLAREGSWVLVPAFMGPYLRSKLGCQIVSLSEPPPEIKVFKIMKKNAKELWDEDVLQIDEALAFCLEQRQTIDR
ncbi:LysR family transcriptional regulator [Burkholderia anthina]|uniref:LysR family transcriptional regulator n=1 Tax=Burkholderia anthina TaxID=179879 RepID=UPI001AA06625|nr:LysR family transcriptional regulator [Burkholderia anthina]QTD95162.1 LysR family transcriptional regulator [Burkholderia anthina]